MNPPNALTVLALAFAGAILCAAEPARTAPAPTAPLAALQGYSVKDFGATGNGKTDDADALQKALDAACRDRGPGPDERAPRVVILPPGTYRIAKTLRLGTNHGNLVIAGTGGSRHFAGLNGNVRILWDGAEGAPMFEVVGLLGFRLSEVCLDGAKKAGTILRINSKPGNASAEFYLERVCLLNGNIGIDLGEDLDMCASDMSFVDVVMDHMKTCGFRAVGGQQVDFVFIRPEIAYTPVAFHFKHGGTTTLMHPCVGWVDTMLKIDEPGINNGVFTIRGMFFERCAYTDEKKRLKLVDAGGECNVTVMGVSTSCQKLWGQEADLETPAFELRPGAQITVIGSMICGKIAKLRGKAGDVPSFIQFDNCRFRCMADPRKDVDCDEFSGYEFRNCNVTVDDTRGKEYKIHERFMIPHLVKYPKQAEGRPGREKTQAAQP